MDKIKFAIIGAGWRSNYYIRIAKQHSTELEICGILVRDQEKADKLSKELGLFVTTSEKMIEDTNPDFIVVSVSRPSITTVSLNWKRKGYLVLCETPVANSKDDLDAIAADHSEGKLMVAEQYMYYPTYKKIIDICKSEKLGDILIANVSVAHEYHGLSVIRKILGEEPTAKYTMAAQSYTMPVTKTGDRFHIYNDGEIINKTRTFVAINYEDGKVGMYDFDSEQYHSLIRHNYIKITGTRGEIMNERCWYLDEHNNLVEIKLTEDFQKVQEQKDEDEAGIYELLKIAKQVTLGNSDILDDNISNGIADAKMTLEMLHTL